MKDLEKTDIDFVREQAMYLHSIKKKICDSGEITLTIEDVDTLDKVSQTLTCFKLFLISNSFQKHEAASGTRS
jgi:hypothetical protein